MMMTIIYIYVYIIYTYHDEQLVGEKVVDRKLYRAVCLVDICVQVCTCKCITAAVSAVPVLF